jgi:hypothetical protein
MGYRFGFGDIFNELSYIAVNKSLQISGRHLKYTVRSEVEGKYK